VKVRQRAKPLPLGVDIGVEHVSVVACDSAGDDFAVRDVQTLEIRRDGQNFDLQIVETLAHILRNLATRERRCILAAPPGDVVTRIFRIPAGMRRAEACRAATLEADSILDWPPSERLIALDAIPGNGDQMLLSIARTSVVERLVSIAEGAGLRPVAVDVPACAWQRAVPDVDAVLDCASERAQLIIFGKPVGTAHVFAPRLVDERLATSVRAAFVEARRDGLADVQHLKILASQFRYESLEALLSDDGYTIAPVALGGVEAPPWTFAYGLALWTVAERGVVTL